MDITVVMNKYHRHATTMRGRVLKLFAQMFCTAPKSSMTAIDAASDVVLSMEITSFPVGGMMTRIAWGSTTRRKVCPLVIPNDVAASVCPSSTEIIPARAISDM